MDNINNPNVSVTGTRDVSDVQNERDKKPSPFAWHDGTVFEFENFKQKKTEKVVSLFEKHLLDEEVRKILAYFARYVYLNSHLVWVLSSADADEELKEEHTKNIIANLFRLGLVSRFRLSYTDGAKVTHSSPFVYCLSSKGQSFFGKNTDRMPSVTEVTRRLAFNQYFISVNSGYKRRLLNNQYDFSEEGNTPDGFLSVKSEGQTLCFNIISARSDPDSHKRLEEVFRSYEKEPAAAFLILAESELSALEMESYRRSVPSFKGFTVLYLCDSRSFDKEHMFTGLILVSDDECTSYSTVNIPIDDL